jgi:hypothetical protein
LIAIGAMLCLGALGCGSDRTAREHVAPSSAAGVSDLLSEVRKRGKLLISTDANYRPLSYRNPQTWGSTKVSRHKF